MSDSRKCYDLKHRENCCVREDAAKELMRTLDAGCSALVWETEDGSHLWGRNFDFNLCCTRFATQMPRSVR